MGELSTVVFQLCQLHQGTLNNPLNSYMSYVKQTAGIQWAEDGSTEYFL